MRSIGRAETVDDQHFVERFRRKEKQTILRAIIEETLAAGHAKSRENHPNDAGALCGHLA